MQYRMLALDLDGALCPPGAARLAADDAAAVRAVQAAGVQVAVATACGRADIPRGMLRGLRPDYWLCAAGGQLLDKAGAGLYASRLTNEEMYALVDFFEDYGYPLHFVFEDGAYAYLGYDAFALRAQQTHGGSPPKDGEDQDHHLAGMPFSAFGLLPPEAAARFGQKYGYLGLQLLCGQGGGCDILRAGQGKGAALGWLLAHAGLDAAACVAVVGGENDMGMLQRAGLGVRMDAAGAGRTCPSVAALCRTLWPEVFPHGE